MNLSTPRDQQKMKAKRYKMYQHKKGNDWRIHGEWFEGWTIEKNGRGKKGEVKRFKRRESERKERERDQLTECLISWMIHWLIKYITAVQINTWHNKYTKPINIGGKHSMTRWYMHASTDKYGQKQIKKSTICNTILRTSLHYNKHPKHTQT